MTSEEPSVVVWRPGDGPDDTLFSAAADAGRADLAIAMPGIEVFGDWLERLSAAAHSDSVIATASAMLSAGSYAPSPLPTVALQRDAESVAESSGRLRPRIGEPHAGCLLLRRSAIDAAGISAEWSTLATALADFGERCGALGLNHVLADDVLAIGRPVLPSADDETALRARYPHREAIRDLDERPESPIDHALLVASRGLDRLSVTVDARCIGPARGGTQIHALELIAALGRTGRVRLRIVTPPDLDPQARDALEQIDDLTFLPYERAAAERLPATDIVHRPNQVFSSSDIALLLPLGHRLIVTHQDLIAYRIAGYHDSVDNWLRYRHSTQSTLAAADHVVFFSDHARRDALADDLIDPGAASVVPIGVDHQAVAHDPARSRPTALPDDDLPFLLCLGAQLPHKNLPFAIGLTAQLRDRHGWEGRLVVAGPAADVGPAPVAEDPPGTPLLRLGPVSANDKAWLLEHAAAVVYPTLYEGFGLIPFEASAVGTPCLFAAQSSLAEILPASTATLVAWDARASAESAAPLLRDGPARTAHIDALRGAAERYRWDDTAQALVELYEAVLVAPLREAGRGLRERLALDKRLQETESQRQEEWRRHLAFRDEIGSDGLGLVGQGGVLEPADQRAMLALLSRPALRRPLMRMARAAYRLAMRLRRRG